MHGRSRRYQKSVSKKTIDKTISILAFGLRILDFIKIKGPWFVFYSRLIRVNSWFLSPDSPLTTHHSQLLKRSYQNLFRVLYRVELLLVVYVFPALEKDDAVVFLVFSASCRTIRSQQPRVGYLRIAAAASNSGRAST